MEFRIVESRFGVLLYPVPVNKAEPYLVIARDRADAEDLKVWLEAERIQPLTSAHFQQTGVHVDGVTKLLAKKP